MTNDQAGYAQSISDERPRKRRAGSRLPRAMRTHTRVSAGGSLPYKAAVAGALLTFVMLILHVSTTQADSPEQVIAQLNLGFEGTYRVGKWTPVWVNLTAADVPLSGRLEITTPDGDGVPATYAALGSPLQLAAGKSAWQLVYVKFGRTQTWLTVSVQDQNGKQVERTFPTGSFPQPAPSSREVILTLGGDLAVSDAIELSRRRGDDAYMAQRQESIAQLPDRWFGYDSVDTIVLVTSNTEYLAKWSDSQVQALSEWVTQGGRLIVSSGGQLPARWASLYPGEFAETQVLRRTTTLEVYAGATQRLDLIGSGKFEMPVTLLADYEGRPLLVDQVAGQSRPIFQLAPRGFGLVLFCAIDLSAAPLDEWRDRPRLMLRLLRLGDETEAAAADGNRSGGRVTHIGYKDLSGQLRSSLEAFSFGGLSLIPFSWVAALILFYILLIGPVDYYFLRRVVGRMEYTWITFPLLVTVLATAAIMLTGMYKGSAVEVRQLAVLDYDLASGTQRHSLWAHVYSPANDRYELATTGQGNRLLSWHGLPGTALGGMQNAASGVTDQTRYMLADGKAAGEVRVDPVGVPINIWSTKSFFSYEWARLPTSEAESAIGQTSLRETYDRRLVGQVKNPTEYELTECQLLYDRWAYSIHGTVAPGDTIYLADEGEPRDLEWKMTRRVVNDENKPVSTPWNARELDTQRIVEMMMFHRAAGGIGYTELTHRQLQYLDLSRHLAGGRAVLVGKTKSPALQLTREGKPLPPNDNAHWTYVRVMIPVEIK